MLYTFIVFAQKLTLHPNHLSTLLLTCTGVCVCVKSTVCLCTFSGEVEGNVASTYQVRRWNMATQEVVWLPCGYRVVWHFGVRNM